MAKQEQTNVGKEQPAIVYRGSSQGTPDKTFSFTITQEQSNFIKAHRKNINFSDTFRKYLDSIIETVKKEQEKKE